MSNEGLLCGAMRHLLGHLGLLLLLPATAVQGGAIHIVGVGDDCSNAVFCFNPSPLVIEPGDTVTFYIFNANSFHGPHNVVADDGSFRCAQGCDGEGGDGSPREYPQWSFNRTFNVPGVVTYHDEVTNAKGVLFVQDPTAPVKLQTAYEYGYRSSPNFVSTSYFVTSSAEEMATLHALSPWRATFETFLVWDGPASGAVPTCRFVDSVFGGHVFTPYAAECAALQTQPRWIYEGNAFYLKLPDENGDCPPGTTRLFRLYNQSKVPPPFAGPAYTKGAPLHRLTTNVATLGEMRSAGWDFEGDSRTFAFACVAF
jgi:plastocyanin